MQIKFRDRSAAGEILALMLKKYKRREEQPIVIIGIPRGGVVVADVVARKISADFDIVIPHYVRFHNNPLMNIVSTRILCTCMIIYINLRNSKETFIVIGIYIENEYEQNMTQCIAFHSYKGGTGKTTIASNLAAMLATRGHNVCFLDLDVYAPSLQAYFQHAPNKWINDLLSDNAGVKDVMEDMTPAIERYIEKVSPGKGGKLWIGFSNPQKEEVYKLEGGGGGKQTNAKLQLLRKFIQLREELISDYDSDYIIIDTSPGIRYWSINSLAIADTLFLTLKFGDLDIVGTKKMASDIYSSFTKFGAKSYLLLNRVGGYCVPHTLLRPQHSHGDASEKITVPQENEFNFGEMVSREVEMDLISAIPCYCDIQFSRKEFLTVLEYPDHPFAKQLERLATTREIKV